MAKIGTLRRRVLVGTPASAAVVSTLDRTASSVASALLGAFMQQRVIRIRYADNAGAITHRDIEALYLYFSLPVKLPQSQLKQQLTRQEIGFEGPDDQVPEAAADLVLATTRGLSLALLMRLHTLRQPLEIRDRAGVVIGEVVDDTVTVTDGPGSPGRFREVEIEAVDRGEAGKLLIEAMTKRPCCRAALLAWSG